MNSTKVFNRQTGYVAMAVALLLATFISALASAAQVTERSIALGNSSVTATGVTYSVNFKAAAAAGAFVVDFCSDTPVIGQPCAAPAGFTAAAATTATSGFTVTPDVSKVVVVGTIAKDQAVSVDLAGITNPTNAGPLYARIVTYDTGDNAALYTSTDLKSGSVDQGGVAMSITSTVGVSGAVLESMVFCVSGAVIADNCATPTTPTLKLGEPTGNGDVALDANKVSTGDIYTQISTNAATGAVVNLKSSALGCGGLINSSKPAACDIKPAVLDGITKGQAKFGVMTSTATDLNADSNGSFQPVALSKYSNAIYALNWVSGDASGVTSTFGDPFLDTDGGPANGKNMKLTFGVSVSNSTPAGNYSTALSLIATGKF